MITRSAKMLLLAGIALYYTLVVFNNLTDFSSNYEFIRHVLSMDTTISRQSRNVAGTDVANDASCFLLADHRVGVRHDDPCVVGTRANLFRALREPADVFNAAKRVAVMALTLSLLMWLVAFLDVGGEWFLMWQSHTWNGQEEAFRMFVIVGFVLLLAVAAGHRHPAVTFQPATIEDCLRRAAYHASPAAI